MYIHKCVIGTDVSSIQRCPDVERFHCIFSGEPFDERSYEDISKREEELYYHYYTCQGGTKVIWQ